MAPDVGRQHRRRARARRRFRRWTDGAREHASSREADADQPHQLWESDCAATWSASTVAVCRGDVDADRRRHVSRQPSRLSARTRGRLASKHLTYYSAFMPASLTTFAQRPPRVAMKRAELAPASSRAPRRPAPRASPSSPAWRGSCRLRALSFATISRGVPGGREDALPRAGLEARHAALGDGRHVGHRREPLGARHRERCAACRPSPADRSRACR